MGTPDWMRSAISGLSWALAHRESLRHLESPGVESRRSRYIDLRWSIVTVMFALFTGGILYLTMAVLALQSAAWAVGGKFGG